MCEQAENNYLDGDIVWVKLGSCWWPGEVVGPEKLPPDVLPSFRKPPIAVVKFFQEDTYEYVKNLNCIFKYNCSRKDEFINKGLYMYRTKHGHMEKFPEDVIRAETAVGGDIKILTRDEFQETKKESYAGLFVDPKKTPVSTKKGKGGRGRPPDSSSVTTPIGKLKEKTNYKVHILLQGSKTPSQSAEAVSTPSTSRAGSEPDTSADKPLDTPEKDSDNKTEETPKPATIVSTPSTSTPGIYACHACNFTTTRLNVLILHNKTHSVTFTPYTPSPVKKKPVTKTPKSTSTATPNSSKTPKQRKPRQEKTDRPPKKSQSKKRAADGEAATEVKKPKTDEEIKSSLLADWDDGDEESNDESCTMTMSASPEVPVAAESPAVPTPAELPSAQVPKDVSSSPEKKSEETSASEKPESSNESKYDFCEDEDWPVEADIGRKIPRLKNPSKRKGDTKSLSIDEEEMAREVAELLNKTTLPELPSAPEPLKVEENFPEPSIVKSPDKKIESSHNKDSPEKKSLTDSQPPKTIFKTKTFFRSRHSRSQDAIGKYVAEQLNAAERMDITESEINGADIVLPQEVRISPPVEQIKVARLAPKIQLKKLKAEAAQLREKEKCNTEKKEQEKHSEITPTNSINMIENAIDPTEEKENSVKPPENEISQDTMPSKRKDDASNTNTSSSESLMKEVNVSNKDENTTTKTEDNINKTEITPNSDEIIENEETSVIKCDIKSDTNLPKSYAPFMNESTASAVDALLSVSRETDRVTKIIGDDPPEDLFEDDNKDNSVLNNVNGFNEENDKNNVETLEQNGIVLCTGSTNKQPQADENFNSNKVDNNDLHEQQEIIPKKIEENLELSANDPQEKIEYSTHTQDNVEISMPPTNVLQENIEYSAPNVSDLQDNLNEPELETHDIQTTIVEEPYVNAPIENPNPELIIKDSSKCFSSESTPSESDLQIAEALMNLPTTTIQNKTCNNHQESLSFGLTTEETPMHIEQSAYEDNNKDVTTDEVVSIENVPEQDDAPSEISNQNINSRFETELEKSENLNAAESLVKMSETIEHKIKIPEIQSPVSQEVTNVPMNTDEVVVTSSEIIANMSLPTTESNIESITARKSQERESNTSKLLKILEEPIIPKVSVVKKPTITKQIIVPSKEKILNFDIGKPNLKPKPSQSPKQKIIIRRTTPHKNILNNVTEVTTADKIILSRSNKPTQEGSSVQQYTIQTTPEGPSDANTIIIQQKIRKLTKPVSKLQKIKSQPQTSLITKVSTESNTQNSKNKDDAMFDINSMPIVLSDDILTPESIEKMPIVMSDGNLITSSSNPPKLIKTKHAPIENEKIAISAVPKKTEVKTLLMSSSNEINKVTTPNILSKSSKLRGAKPMLVIDKTTGKQKIIMTKSEPAVKEIKQTPTLIQPSQSTTTNKTEKFIIVPTQNSPRPGRTQKIVIDPQTGKAHVLVGKGPEPPISLPDNKPVSAKLIAPSSDANTPGNTVMIITNAQGAQSRIVLTPEHEKILFPNKQQQNVTQLKTITHRINSNTGTITKTVTSAAQKTPTRIVPKQKSAIITSKGQLIVGGRIATTAQNIAPLPEIRPAPKRILATEPKKLVQAIQKTSSEPLIFLQQKSGAVMQLTAAQFEHLQRTGQIIQKAPAQENKIIVQKSITIPSKESAVPTLQKTRVRKQISEAPLPTKKVKHEIAIAPAPSPIVSMPALTPLSNTIVAPQLSNVSSATTHSTPSNYSELENYDELLPSTAIAKQPEPTVTHTEVPAQPPPAPLSDGQLLAVPGEHFGGPTGSFYLCVEENGTFTPIDNRPLVLENNQLVPMAETMPVLAPQPERRDILEAALANSDVFHAEGTRDEAPDFRDLNANVSVHCRVSETSTTLNQPIMTPVEVPSKVDSEPTTVPSNLEDGLAVIGVTPHTVPTSLELPITVTDPRIAPKTTDPLSNNNYGTSLLTSPNTEMTFITTEEADVPVVGPISMPLLTEEDSVGKSMPILTDEVTERTVSSVESTIGSPSSIDVRESENEDSGQWHRRLLTPCSDTSETSAEIPLQPVMQLSVNDLSHSS